MHHEGERLYRLVCFQYSSRTSLFSPLVHNILFYIKVVCCCFTVTQTTSRAVGKGWTHVWSKMARVNRRGGGGGGVKWRVNLENPRAQNLFQVKQLFAFWSAICIRHIEYLNFEFGFVISDLKSPRVQNFIQIEFNFIEISKFKIKIWNLVKIRNSKSEYEIQNLRTCTH